MVALHGKVSPHWADQIALDLISQSNVSPSSVLTCCSGISPSGAVHVGNLRDVFTASFVVQSLRNLGQPARLIHSWDNFDRFRKVPYGVPPSFAEFIGKPLSHVPDPGDCHASYAKHHEQIFEASLGALGIEMAYRDQSVLYQSGIYRSAIEEAIRARREIYDILARFRTQEGSDAQREQYVPVTIYCKRCFKDTTQIQSIEVTGDLFSYRCTSCRNEDVLSLETDTNVKLPWKIDWAMRWRHEGTVFEPGGKDHATRGGSFEVASEIALKVYHTPPPRFQPYEFVGLKGQVGKMSGSSGALITPGDILKIYQPEVLRWVFAQTPPTRAFDIVVDETLVRIYDSFDGAHSTQRQGTNNVGTERALSLASLPDRQVYPVPFRHLAHFADIVQGNRQAIEEIFTRIGTPYPKHTFEERLQKVEAWLTLYASERTVLRDTQDDAYYQTLTPEEKKWLASLCLWLDDKQPPPTLPEATEKVYAIPKEGLSEESDARPKQKRFFQIVYHLLFGKDSGPRLGTFMAAVPSEKYIKLIDFRTVTMGG